MIDPPDDHELVHACRAGNADAFGLLVRRYQDRLYPTIVRLLGSAEDARDVLQDAFVRAYVKLDQFHESSSFYTWIYRIAINLAISRNRRRGRRTFGFSQGGRIGQNAVNPIDPRREADPGAELDRVEREEQIQRALATLSPEHREVVILKDLEDHRYEEIAELLNVPIGTVRSRLHRARSELRQRLGGLLANELTPQQSQTSR